MTALRLWRRSSLLILAGLVAGAVSGRPAIAGMTSTAHDFSAGGEAGRACMSCHTPHSASVADLGWTSRRPLASFRWSDASETAGGTRLPTNVATWSGSTKVCLACHDGTIDVRTFGAGGRGLHGFGPAGDLKGNHPVAIPYPYNRMKNTYNGITTGDEALRSGWVSAPRDVKLYADPAGPAPFNRGIECATCHDPHGTANVMLLRAAERDLCVRCHQK